MRRSVKRLSSEYKTQERKGLESSIPIVADSPCCAFSFLTDCQTKSFQVDVKSAVRFLIKQKLTIGKNKNDNSLKFLSKAEKAHTMTKKMFAE